MVLLIINIPFACFVMYFCFCFLKILFCKSIKVEQINSQDLIIVLGATVKGLTVSSALHNRLEVLKQIKSSPTIILSGGKETSEQLSEAKVMQLYCKSQFDINREFICESNSSNTYQNIIYSNQICDFKKYQNVVIISNSFHIYRAQKMARDLGFKNICALGVKNPKKKSIYIKETFAYIQYQLILMQDKMRLR